MSDDYRRALQAADTVLCDHECDFGDLKEGDHRRFRLEIADLVIQMMDSSRAAKAKAPLSLPSLTVGRG